MTNIWILTEEFPKANVIKMILERVAIDLDTSIIIKNKLVILPIIKNGKFTFVYRVAGFESKRIDLVQIKIASGNSSFVDFLVFLQDNEPAVTDVPIYAIEETKTDDSESRNTGIYQRSSKFVYVDFFYPGIKKIMLYNLQIPQKKNPTLTNIFGMRMLRTIGVEVIGKTYHTLSFKPFLSIEEMASVKNSIPLPRSKSNVPIKIQLYKNKATISGRLYKNGTIGHDPNIGALAIIGLCIRKLNKNIHIVIVRHGLQQSHVGRNNKFIQIANRLKLELEGLKVPTAAQEPLYWHYDVTQEKNATILLHVALIAHTNADVIYSNHGGSERGYFYHILQGPIAVEKYQKGMRDVYKAGDKSKIIYIPDVIVFDPTRKEIINIEGKRFETRSDGIQELANYSYIEKSLIIPSHKPSRIIRAVVIFGSKETRIQESKICFLLNSEGAMVLNNNSPVIIREAISRALRF